MAVIVRYCLRCNEKFGSKHKGNRICPGCTKINNNISTAHNLRKYIISSSGNIAPISEDQEIRNAFLYV